MLRYLFFDVLFGNLVWLGLALSFLGAYLLELADLARWKIAAWPLMGMGGLVVIASLAGQSGRIVSGAVLLLVPAVILAFASWRNAR